MARTQQTTIRFAPHKRTVIEEMAREEGIPLNAFIERAAYADALARKAEQEKAALKAMMRAKVLSGEMTLEELQGGAA